LGGSGREAFLRCRQASATSKTVVARLDRAIQYAAASRLIADVSGILARPVAPGDDGGVRASVPCVSTAAFHERIDHPEPA
jgi:hypothetical protein